jgi:hypothetical protein
MRERRGVYRVLVGKPEGKKTTVDGRIILKWIFKEWNWVIDQIYLFQDRGRWRALVNAVMNLRFP